MMTCNKSKISSIRRVGVFLCVFYGMFIASCELSTTVPYDIPDYNPQLIIHGVASPQSGGVVLIKYDQPIFDLPGRAPDLPALEVYLLEEGDRIHRFYLDSISINTERPDRNNQTGYFRIDVDSLILQEGLTYALEVIDLDREIRYKSTEVNLPDRPQVNHLDIQCNSDYWDNCSVNLELGSTNERVSAISIRVYPPDSIRNKGPMRIFDFRLFDNIVWPDNEIREKYPVESIFSQRHSIYPDSTVLLDSVNLHISYLSTDLSLLLRQIRESDSPGESINTQPRPFHSNFSNAIGIFGLYNEEIIEIKLP